MSSPINLCFIGGSGRSGTTILKKIFACHPQVADIPEWRFSIDPDGLVDFFNTFSVGWSPYLFDVKLKRLERLLRRMSRRRPVYRYLGAVLRYSGLNKKIPYKLTPAYTGLGITTYCPDYPQLVEQLMAQLVDFRYTGSWVGANFLEKSTISYQTALDREALAAILGHFMRQVIESAVKSQKACHYVEDNTWNILWFDKLRELLPEAKLVHIYRDPRDVVASYTTQNWTPTDPVEAAKFYRGIMERWQQVRQYLPPDAYREIALEALVANPETVLRDICQFWEIDWHEVLLSIDLSRSNSGRWRRDLTTPQQEAVQSILMTQISELGYQNE